ncbi:MAG: DUF7948 domain-containing protein [Planctomycetota bacterium]|jgi:hypothetical protein
MQRPALGVPSRVLSTLLVGALLAATAAMGAMVLAPFQAPGSQSPRDLEAPSKAQANAMLQRQAACFVPNLGQWEHPARYVAKFGAMTVFLEGKGWVFTLSEKERGAAVRMQFTTSDSDPRIEPEDQLVGVHNYFLGNDPARWRSDVPRYGAVCYRGVQPGVDVRTREHDGHFEFDLLLEAGAELEPVEIVVEGASRLYVDDDGALVLETALGPVRMPAPPSWEESPSGEKSPVACRYVLRGEDRLGFEAPGRRPDWALVVDPGLVWSTYLGGDGFDQAHEVALDVKGAATVTGSTGSADFPTTTGAFDTTFNGNQDFFVARLSPSGSGLVWSTFMGGSGPDGVAWLGGGLALDAQGAVTVAGFTSSANFPVTKGVFDTTYNGGTDLFVARLSPSGASLVYSTFLGGAGVEWGHALALDAQGAATVAGRTKSANFPTTAFAFDTTHNGGDDAFVAQLSPSGSSLVWSTFLGGTGRDWGHALAVDARGIATVTGWTTSGTFPTTTGAFDTTHNGGEDGFVTRLSPLGASLLYSTFLGGTSSERPYALTVDAQGTATVAGWTTSANFPTTTGAFDRTYNGGFGDAFVAKLSPKGSSLVYSTYLGGDGSDWAYAVALDGQGGHIVTGDAGSSNFPTTPGAFDTTFNGNGDAFVTRFSPSGGSLVYSTFLGGSNWDLCNDLALDAQGAAVVVGFTDSGDFSTTANAFDPTNNRGRDGFVARLEMLPTGVSAFGTSTPGCNGPLAISVTSIPRIGNAAFALTCGNAPPNGSGLIAFSGAQLQKPLVILGAGIWVDTTSPAFLVLPVTSNGIGAAVFKVPVPNDSMLVGVRAFTQFVWSERTQPPPCPPLGLSASNSLDITVQR